MCILKSFRKWCDEVACKHEMYCMKEKRIGSIKSVELKCKYCPHTEFIVYKINNNSL